MSAKLQRYERHEVYAAPVCCVFCGWQIQSFQDDEPTLRPCQHTLFVAHDEGYEYLADRVVRQLHQRGFEVKVDDGFIEVEPPTGMTERSSPDFVTDDLEFPDGLKVASYEGPPSGSGSYIGFAPVIQE